MEGLDSQSVYAGDRLQGDSDPAIDLFSITRVVSLKFITFIRRLRFDRTSVKPQVLRLASLAQDDSIFYNALQTRDTRGKINHRCAGRALPEEACRA
jgi:hypothetical protein